MPFRILKWGLHSRILIKAYTLFFIVWMIFWLLVVIAYVSINLYNVDLLSLFSVSLIILLLFVLPPFLPLYYYYRKSSKVSPESTVKKKEWFLEKDNLFDDWNQLIILHPEEKIVHVYRDVKSLYHADEIKNARQGMIAIHRGDIVLTDKRLAYLEYRYKKLSSKMRFIRILSILLFLFAIIVMIPAIIAIIVSINIYNIALILLMLFCLFLSSKMTKLLETPPVGYAMVGFEIFLENIVETNWDSLLSDYLGIKIKYRKEPILVSFRNDWEANEFRKNLPLLVYKAQHLPKEVIQYNVVTKFYLDKDGTISIQCPHCGASTPLHLKESEVACKYCGKQYIVPKKILDLIR